MLLCLLLFSVGQPGAAQARETAQVDYSGNWAGVLRINSNEGKEIEWRVRMRFVSQDSGYQIELSRLEGNGTLVAIQTGPASLDAGGRLDFTVTLPLQSGQKAIAFRIVPTYARPTEQTYGIHFTAGDTDSSDSIHGQLNAGRLQPAPRRIYEAPGLTAANRPKWPITLSEYTLRESDERILLMGVLENAAIYSRDNGLQPFFILHDILADQPIVSASSAQSQLTLSKAEQARIAQIYDLLPKGRYATRFDRAYVYHLVKGVYPTDAFYQDFLIQTSGTHAELPVPLDRFRAQNSNPALTASAIVRATDGQQLTMDTAQQKRDADQPLIAEARAYAASVEQRRMAAIERVKQRSAGATGTIYHGDAYWAGLPYDPGSGEKPGSDLRVIFEGRMTADPGSPLQRAYLGRYVTVTGEACGKQLGWPQIAIRTTTTMSRRNRLGTPLGTTQTSDITRFYVDPILYPEFSASVDPETQDYYTPLQGLKFVMDFISGKETVLHTAVEQHLKATRAIRWLADKAGCNSPEMKQLARNIKFLTLGDSSLQDRKSAATGSRVGDVFYAENGTTFYGPHPIAPDTLKAPPLVSGGRSFDWRSLVREYFAKTDAQEARQKFYGWYPVVLSDDAGNAFVLMNSRDPLSSGDDVRRFYVSKVSASEIAQWRAIQDRYDLTLESGNIRADADLPELKLVRLLQSGSETSRIHASDDWPSYFEAAKGKSSGARRPPTVAEWLGR